MAETEFAAVLGRWESDFGLWPPILRTIAVFLAFGGGSMSVELVRWLPKAGFFLSTPVGTQRACPLEPTACFKTEVLRVIYVFTALMLHGA